MFSRTAWLFLAAALATFGLAGCDLNPQPEVPGDNGGAAGSTGTAGMPGTAGAAGAPAAISGSTSKQSSNDDMAESGDLDDPSQGGFNGTPGGGRPDAGPPARDAGPPPPPPVVTN